MDEIIEILMHRDGNTRKEAIARIKEAVSMMAEWGYDHEECERIIVEELGLELDYLPDLIFDMM